MALGFLKDYDTSTYDKPSFIRMWPKISKLGTDMIQGMMPISNGNVILRKGDTNEYVVYLKGCMFLLGYSSVDSGNEYNEYDDYLSDAVVRCRRVFSKVFGRTSNVDLVDSGFVNNLKSLFAITDTSEISSLYTTLGDSRADTITRGSSSPYSSDSQSVSVMLPPSSKTSKVEGIFPGNNYPNVNTEWASQSVLYSLKNDGNKKLGNSFTVRDFRCKDNSDVILVNPNLISTLEMIKRHFGGKNVHIVSGYRTPSYNRSLRKRGVNAAKNSQHQYGNAADISIDGVSPREIYNWLNTFHKGGLGLYKNFIHVDVRDTIQSNLAHRARWGTGAKSKA